MFYGVSADVCVTKSSVHKSTSSTGWLLETDRSMQFWSWGRWSWGDSLMLKTLGNGQETSFFRKTALKMILYPTMAQVAGGTGFFVPQAQPRS